ncbi:MAG TPA: ribosome maturation factor RimM [Candidatus Cybelea sp.]|jgi:16S rRNA processing protein RimM|nr:ribosome maturation factor RimM [Candidatus Cybelea sp.]
MANEIVVGRIAGVFGVRGELKCDPTSAGRIAFAEGAILRCQRDGASSSIRLSSVRPHKNRLLVRIEGADDADAAQAYVGASLYAPRESADVAADEYLDADLVGCSVFGANGTAYGTVERVEHFPSSDMLVVSGQFVPMVSAIVTNVDLGARRITIDPPEGLFTASP